MTRAQALKNERATGKAADKAGARYQDAIEFARGAAKGFGQYSKKAIAARAQLSRVRAAYRTAYENWQTSKRRYDAIVEREDWS